jgi:hypothetical protein
MTTSTSGVKQNILVLIPDIKFSILEFTPQRDMIALTKISPDWRICVDAFIDAKVRDLGDQLENPDIQETLAFSDDILTLMRAKNINAHSCLIGAYDGGNIFLAGWIIETKNQDLDLTSEKLGVIDWLFDNMLIDEDTKESIYRHNSWNARRGGHRDLVEWMISKGANQWNGGLWGACGGGHRDLAELMIARGNNN